MLMSGPRTGVAVLLLSAGLPARLAPAKMKEVPVIHVGDASMSGRRLVPYDNLWIVRMHYNDGRVIDLGLSTDHVRRVAVNGRQLMSRLEGEADLEMVTRALPSASSSLTFNIFDPVNMAPARGESYGSPSDSMIHEFDGRTVITSEAGKPAVAHNLVEAPFDVHGGMTGLLLAALPLQAGFKARLPGLTSGGDLDYTLVEVVGRAAVDAGASGRRSAWVVDVGDRPATKTYWISKRVPYVLKAVVRGSEGFASWEMLAPGPAR